MSGVGGANMRLKVDMGFGCGVKVYELSVIRASIKIIGSVCKVSR